MATEFELSFTGSEVNKKLGKIDGLVEAKERLSNEIAIERARIDTFTALADGSTTGDAELQDARIDFTGTTHNNVGEAVRHQVSALFKQIDDVTKLGINMLDREQTIIGSYYKADGEPTITVGGCRSTQFIPIEANTAYSWTSGVNTQINTYSASKEHIERLQTWVSPAYSTCVFDEDVAFVRLSFPYESNGIPDEFMFCRGYVPEIYVPFEYQVNTDAIPDGEITGNKLCDGTVSEDKTTFFEHTCNMFDNTKILTDGAYHSSGVVYTGATGCRSEQFIPVESGQMYYWTPTTYLMISTYSSNYTHIERLSAYSGDTIKYSSYKFNDDVAFIRLSRTGYTEFPYDFMFCHDGMPGTYIPFGYHIKPDTIQDNTITGNKLQNGAVSEEKTTFFEQSYNLLDREQTVTGSYYNSTGSVFSSDDACRSTQFIPIEAEKAYCWTPNYSVQINTYNKDRIHIRRLQTWVSPAYSTCKFTAKVDENDTDDTKKMVAGDDEVAFIRISFPWNKDIPKDFMFQKGDTFLDAYVDYGYVFASKYLQNANPTPNDDISIAWFGDSISQLKQLPHRVAGYMNSTIYDCSFAGSVMSYHYNANNQGIGFLNISNCISSGDFTSLENAINGLEADKGTTLTDIRANFEVLRNLDFNKITTIVVLLGTNDYGSGTPTLEEFKGAMSEAITNILTAYPHIQMYFISPIWRGIGETTCTKGYLPDYVQAEKEVCESFNIPFYDLYHNSGINSLTKGIYLNDDELHQTVDGDILLAKKCAKFLLAN